MATEPLPVTGAWALGDPPGNRKFFTFASDHPFAVESGAVLRDVTVAYETWGTLSSDASNASWPPKQSQASSLQFGTAMEHTRAGSDRVRARDNASAFVGRLRDKAEQLDAAPEEARRLNQPPRPEHPTA